MKKKGSLRNINVNEQGIGMNENKIEVRSQGNVTLTLGNTQVKIHGKTFKVFCEWYLEEQEI